MSRIKDRRARAVKRRNPMARALRARVFQAKRLASRKKYTRKAKHRERDKADPAPED